MSIYGTRSFSTSVNANALSEAEPNNNKFLENEFFMSIHGMK